MRRLRTSWPAAALLVVLTVAIVLFATGHLKLQWRSATQAGSVDSKDDAHGHGKSDEPGEEGERVSGDKAVLDGEAIKAPGIRDGAGPEGLGGRGASVDG